LVIGHWDLVIKRSFPLINAVLGRVSAGDDLSMAEMTETIDAIMRGEWSEQQIMMLLTALRHKEETVDEIAGAAAAMRRHMTPIRTRRSGVMDTCGTGGVGSDIFNVSTAAAIVTAAAGVPVAKHGNRSITSKSGSADVLQQLGVKIDASVVTIERCLDELGICFCFAPQLHSAMKHVASARKKLGTRSIFNLLGPLCNPASATYQLLGVGSDPLHAKIAGALKKLGTHRAVVVTGNDGLGEVSLSTSSRVTIVEGDSSNELVWQPSDFGLKNSNLDPLRVDGPAASAAMIRSVLNDDVGAPHDMVVLNAAAALWTAGADQSLPACAARAEQAIKQGKARELLARLVEVSNG
jgi:anthranilate phosphoribosyltransferase